MYNIYLLMSSNFASFWQKHIPGELETSTYYTQRTTSQFHYVRSVPCKNWQRIFTAYNTSSNIRDTALNCPKPDAIE